jgi:DNA-directed RNA polymerase subunit beta
MNLGQIYETVLGWAGEKLGMKFSTPIFDGATPDEINDLGQIKQVFLNQVKRIYLMVVRENVSISQQQLE